jgi:hypothetical protein
MDPVQVSLWSFGTVLIVIGAIKHLRREKNALWVLFPGIILFILGCLILTPLIKVAS